ncbi:MAG: hypothetical protein Q9175_005703 [Cornicularia normoerica]
MATEPDDYQTVSDNCPGYMVLIAEGIICTRCAGEKRHKLNECPKPTTAADLATETVPEEDPCETENPDLGMESLSDTSSVSSESTARSESSEIHLTDAHQSDQGGSHSQNTNLPRRGFARLDGSHTSTEPDRTSSSPPSRRAASGLPLYDPSQVHEILVKAERQASDKATHEPETQSHRDTRGKFEYSNTTCPSSFGFGRLPSEAMG